MGLEQAHVLVIKHITPHNLETPVSKHFIADSSLQFACHACILVDKEILLEFLCLCILPKADLVVWVMNICIVLASESCIVNVGVWLS